MNGLRLSPALARSASAFAIATCLMVPGAAFAQTASPNPGAVATDAQPSSVNSAIAQADAQTGDEVVVTGIRASLERSIAIKRDSTGVVDAISSEDIGKFPDTNLAESLQRITGVSIDRRNGEGSTVTVRGFGADYNLVTLNGRQLAATNIVAVGGDQGGDGAGGFGRSFDFSNIASEGVKTLEVYKTGRAAIPTGGIGATINVVTRKPLDTRETGLNGSIGAKADYDRSTRDCVSCGSKVTPEVSGLLSWSNEDQTFGVSVYGSYQRRNFSVPSVANNGWNIVPVADFLSTATGTYVTSKTQLNNAPSSGYVAVPDDFRYHFSEDRRTRFNTQGVAQFRPSDQFEFEVDGLYVRNTESERRSDESNWFNRPFDVVTFTTQGNSNIHTATYLHETENGSTKDTGSEQAYRAQKNELWDVGGNMKFHPTDSFTISVDGHIGKASSLPDNPNGQTSTTVAFSSPILSQWGLDQSNNGFPVLTSSINDAAKGNNNGVWDVGDLATQVERQFRSTQTQKIKEARLDAGWDIGHGIHLDFGGDYRSTNTRQTQYNTQLTMGDWGNALPRDLNAIAPGQVQEFCLVCTFHHHDPKATGDALISWRTEDATKLYNTLYNYYTNPANPNGGKANSVSSADNRVRENIWAAYAQATWKGQIADHDASLVVGARYEQTRVKSVSLQTVPTAIVWQSDNDFLVQFSSDQQPVSGKGRYREFLPSADFQINLQDNVIARASYSRTISRAGYGDLFAATTVGAPGRPTSLGGTAGGNAHNPDLDPLVSDNYDVSFEWYMKPGSYLSVGGFAKTVHNFIGNSVVTRQLFGLRDPTAAASGSRSGTAKTQLQALGYDLSDVNLFTYTALLQQNNGSTAAATAAFNSHYDPATRSLQQAFVDDVAFANDIIADANDPLFNFNINTPINNKNARIWGAEFAGEYFLGHTGFGIAASYTLVRSNVHADVQAAPTANQFALIGLSDTYNVTAIYDKNGISARLAWNYRKKFLSALNVGGSHNPVFTAPYGQLDLNVSYDITPKLSVSFEGINLNEESVHTYARDKNETLFLQEGSARFLLGARYKF